MNKDYKDFLYIFHSTQVLSEQINSYIQSKNISNCEVISDEKIKSHTLKKSVFAVAKSGTVSLELCKFKIPSIIIYKMNFLNYLIVKSLVKIKYANIINFIFKLKDLRKIDDRNYDLFILSVRKFIQLDKDFEYLLESEANKTWLTQNIIKMNDYKNKSLDYLLSITIFCLFKTFEIICSLYSP